MTTAPKGMATPGYRIRKLTPRVLVDLVGEKNAKRLMELCGGRRIPNLSPAMRERELRRLRILREIEADKPYRQIAADLGVDVSTVSRCAKQPS